MDHCTYLTDADVEALAGSETVATFLPATDFSTRQPYPDARRVIDAGAAVAIATNCNPGSSYTTSMGFCLALAVRDMHMTAEEALLAADPRRRPRAAPHRRRPAGARRPRRRRGARRAVLLAPRLPPRRAARGRHHRGRPAGVDRPRRRHHPPMTWITPLDEADPLSVSGWAPPLRTSRAISQGELPSTVSLRLPLESCASRKPDPRRVVRRRRLEELAREVGGAHEVEVGVVRRAGEVEALALQCMVVLVDPARRDALVARLAVEEAAVLRVRVALEPVPVDQAERRP